MSYQYLGETDQERARRIEDENRQRQWAIEDRPYEAQKAREAAEAAQLAQIQQTSAALAVASQRPAQIPDYLRMVNQGSFAVPRGPGGVSRAASGLGQGILVLSILGGAVLVMVILFFMLKPKTVSQMPMMYGARPGWRPKKKSKKRK
jgi:hypothetical protein